MIFQIQLLPDPGLLTKVNFRFEGSVQWTMAEQLMCMPHMQEV